VAEFYKEMGLLNKDLPSSNYWPGSFEDINLTLEKEAVLSRMISIGF
jgi:hypothetical protein